VVPVHDASGTVIGVLDVDSHRAAHFDAVDAEGYERIVRLIEDHWNS
jgi:GAF domain-containing protein